MVDMKVVIVTKMGNDGKSGRCYESGCYFAQLAKRAEIFFMLCGSIELMR